MEIQTLHRYTPQNEIDISFFVPCYNEEKNVIFSLETVQKALKEFPHLRYEICVVDDASQDNTSQHVKAYVCQHKDAPISLYQNTQNQGIGKSYLIGAKRTQGKWFMLINGDNDTPLQCIRDILKELGTADMLIPSVLNHHERPLIRQFFSLAFVKVVRFIAKNNVKYFNAPVLHKRETILNCPPKVLGPGYQAEIICKAINRGLSYKEIGMHCIPNHKFGMLSPKNMLYVLGTFCVLLKERWQIKK